MSTLFELFWILNKRWAQEWVSSSEHGYSVTQALALEMLEAEGRLMASHLAVSLSLSTGGITGITDKLVRDQLIQRTRNKGDRRIVYLEITEQGRELLKVLRNQRIELMEKFLEPLSKMKMQELLKFNKKLYKHTCVSD
ncbi:MarR family winged helix-turn-helix transcriptional regulator [Peribacillus sp. NPDC097675]|uniref:MarR family winged helix-turn-helix transcriptional regulator n=1 Tax=Peribacillus sp. NPDC097675 TaxID=3390618 RepID=UPI003D06531C